MVTTLYSRTLPAGSKIFAEGEDGDVAYIIESGSVQVSTIQYGKRVVLGILVGGHLLGEMAMIDQAPRTATAITLEETVLTIISRDQLHERLNAAEPILRLLVDVIMSRYRSGLNKAKGTPLASQLNTPLPEEDSFEEAFGEHYALNKIRLENELKFAIENEDLKVFYQPLLGIEQNHWAGFEALVRWKHPERGLISPLEFITLAEESDSIIDIGLFVLRKACEDLVELQAIRDKVIQTSMPLFIGVNVSSRQLEKLEFIDQITDIVKQTGLPASSLKLEITESVAADYKTVIRWVKCCKEMGFTVAIDDFGTGYSSLEHLLELDVDTLKIDQAFVRQLGENEKAEKLVRGVVSLSKALGYSIVAEGIETETQLNTLRNLKCEYGQGYLIGKPQTKTEIIEQLTNGA